MMMARIAIDSAAEKKASKIILQDLRGISDFCQFHLICSGGNEKQTQAICTNIEEKLRTAGIRAYAIEGKQTGQWILIDYGSLIVHIFNDAVREHYSLETLFQGAKNVEISQIPSQENVTG